MYGRHIKTYIWSSKGGALVDRKLEIYQLKRGIKVLLWDCSKKGWRTAPNKPINGKNGTKYPFMNINEILTSFGVPSNATIFDEVNSVFLRKVKVDWELDDLAEDELPKIVEVPTNVGEEEIADWLSDEYGFLVSSFSFC